MCISHFPDFCKIKIWSVEPLTWFFIFQIFATWFYLFFRDLKYLYLIFQRLIMKFTLLSKINKIKWMNRGLANFIEGEEITWYLLQKLRWWKYQFKFKMLLFFHFYFHSLHNDKTFRMHMIFEVYSILFWLIKMINWCILNNLIS